MSEKKPLESKKFIAFLASSAIWVVAMVGALLTMRDTAGFSTTLLAMVISLGFIQALYIGGQAAVDTFVRIGVAFASRPIPHMSTPIPPEDPTPPEDPAPEAPDFVSGPDSL